MAVPYCILTTSINADIHAQIIRESVQLLTESSLEVHAVVFDGTSKNLNTADRLGCPKKLKTLIAVSNTPVEKVERYI